MLPSLIIGLIALVAIGAVVDTSFLSYYTGPRLNNDRSQLAKLHHVQMVLSDAQEALLGYAISGRLERLEQFLSDKKVVAVEISPFLPQFDKLVSTRSGTKGESVLASHDFDDLQADSGKAGPPWRRQSADAGRHRAADDCYLGIVRSAEERHRQLRRPTDRAPDCRLARVLNSERGKLGPIFPATGAPLALSLGGFKPEGLRLCGRRPGPCPKGRVRPRAIKLRRLTRASCLDDIGDALNAEPVALGGHSGDDGPQRSFLSPQRDHFPDSLLLGLMRDKLAVVAAPGTNGTEPPR